MAAEPIPIKLVIEEPDKDPRVERFEQKIVKIGRGARKGIDVSLEDTSVARLHATIQVQGPEKVFILDMGSSGTLLNGKKIGARGKITNGSELELGKTLISVTLGDEARLPEPFEEEVEGAGAGDVGPGIEGMGQTPGLDSGDYYAESGYSIEAAAPVAEGLPPSPSGSFPGTPPAEGASPHLFAASAEEAAAPEGLPFAGGPQGAEGALSPFAAPGTPPPLPSSGAGTPGPSSLGGAFAPGMTPSPSASSPEMPTTGSVGATSSPGLTPPPGGLTPPPGATPPPGSVPGATGDFAAQGPSPTSPPAGEPAFIVPPGANPAPELPPQYTGASLEVLLEVTDRLGREFWYEPDGDW